MTCLHVENLTVVRSGRRLISGINLSLSVGEVVAVLGPNGAGKSTLFRAITDEYRADEGRVTLNGQPAQSTLPQLKALTLGILPQSSSLNFPFSVLEVVLLGRSPCSTSRAVNRDVALQALEKVDALYLQERDYTTLSGGEKQRIHMARVLAQIWDKPESGNRVLLLDEPTSALDPAHQHVTLKVARELSRNGVGVLVILHDLNLASQYADRIVMLREGVIQADGSPKSVLTQDQLRDVFDIDVCIMQHPRHGYPLVVAE